MPRTPRPHCRRTGLDGLVEMSVKRVAYLCASLLLTGACSGQPSFDSVAALRAEYASRIGDSRAAQIQVPFELEPQLAQQVDRELQPTGSDRRRVRRILDYIFTRLDLRYALTPTRDANSTFRAREGNCLSFVNLFIGLARRHRMAPFYVEVRDYQRWTYRDGLVVSRGHIVAGIYVGGELRTYDFLPYRPKSYRDFHPIDDRTAAAHYYNNLAAEALLAGDLAAAERLAVAAVEIAPAFTKAWNNLGVVQARMGEGDVAETTYRRGLELEPDNVALLTNLARLHQESGDHQVAARLLARVDELHTTNPFYYVSQAERALAEQDPDRALERLRRALRLDSEAPEVHVALVKTYLALGELQKARHHLERALKLDATHPEARRLAGLVPG